jgi:hypothetical protein
MRTTFIVGVCLFALMPAVSAVGQEAIKVSASEKAACMPDAIKLCRDAMPNVQSVLACFSRNRDKISGRCNAVLAGYGF